MHSNSDKSILFSTLSEFSSRVSFSRIKKATSDSIMNSAVPSVSIYPCQSFLLLFPEFLLYQSTDNSEENTAAGNFFLFISRLSFFFRRSISFSAFWITLWNHPDYRFQDIFCHTISDCFLCKCKITVSTEDYDLQRRISSLHVLIIPTRPYEAFYISQNKLYVL